MIVSLWAKALQLFAGLAGIKAWHIVAASIVAWSSWVGYKAYNFGKAEVISDSKKAGKKNAKKSLEAHRAAKSPGAAERLRNRADCRDCE